MLFLWFLLLVSCIVQCMDTPSQNVGALVRALRSGEDEKVIQAVVTGSQVSKLNEQDEQGSYLLHWAVLGSLKKVNGDKELQAYFQKKFKVVDVLLQCGANYTLQERDSRRTVFHILALHLAERTDNELVLSVLDSMLKKICKLWFCKAPSKALGQQDFIAEMSRVFASKNKADESVITIAMHRKCVSFCSEERCENAYEAAYAELASSGNAENK